MIYIVGGPKPGTLSNTTMEPSRRRCSKVNIPANGPIYGTLPPLRTSVQQLSLAVERHLCKIAMDSDSDYEKEAPSTEASTPTEVFSIESLIQRVEEFQRRDQLETIERNVNRDKLFSGVLEYADIAEGQGGGGTGGRVQTGRRPQTQGRSTWSANGAGLRRGESPPRPVGSCGGSQNHTRKVNGYLYF